MEVVEDDAVKNAELAALVKSFRLLLTCCLMTSISFSILNFSLELKEELCALKDDEIKRPKATRYINFIN